MAPNGYVTLRLHYGGEVVNNSYYNGGEEATSEVDPDNLSYFKLLQLLKEIGCPENSPIYHKLPPTHENGLVRLDSDVAMRDMFAMFAKDEATSAPSEGIISTYLHTSPQPGFR